MAESPNDPSAAASESRPDHPVPSGCGCACCGGHRAPRRGWRARWAAIGAAVAVVAGTGGVAWSGASSADVTPSRTFIRPCRIMDTRPAPNTVGQRSTPLAGGETHSIQATGVNGNCNIPIDAVGVTLNLTAVGPGSNGFITVFPATDPRPTSSNINVTAGQAPEANLVSVGLGEDGRISFFASGGPVNLIADIVDFTTAARLSTVDSNSLQWQRDRARPATITVGSLPRAVVSDGSNVWVTNGGSNSISKIDPAQNFVGGQVSVGAGPSGIAFDGTSLWVANAASNNVTRINAQSATVIGGAIAVGTSPFGVAFDGHSIWVANTNAGTVSRIDATTATVTGTVTVGSTPVLPAFDGSNVWVPNFGGSSVSKLRAS